jgi:hypothetical protein
LYRRIPLEFYEMGPSSNDPGPKAPLSTLIKGWNILLQLSTNTLTQYERYAHCKIPAEGVLMRIYRPLLTENVFDDCLRQIGFIPDETKGWSLKEPPLDIKERLGGHQKILDKIDELKKQMERRSTPTPPAILQSPSAPNSPPIKKDHKSSPVDHVNVIPDDSSLLSSVFELFRDPFLKAVDALWRRDCSYASKESIEKFHEAIYSTMKKHQTTQGTGDSIGRFDQDMYSHFSKLFETQFRRVLPQDGDKTDGHSTSMTAQKDETVGSQPQPDEKQSEHTPEFHGDSPSVIPKTPAVIQDGHSVTKEPEKLEKGDILHDGKTKTGIDETDIVNKGKSSAIAESVEVSFANESSTENKVDNDESDTPNEDSSSNGDKAINHIEQASTLDNGQEIHTNDTTSKNENEEDVDEDLRDNSQSEQSATMENRERAILVYNPNFLSKFWSYVTAPFSPSNDTNEADESGKTISDQTQIENSEDKTENPPEDDSENTRSTTQQFNETPDVELENKNRDFSFNTPKEVDTNTEQELHEGSENVQNDAEATQLEKVAEFSTTFSPDPSPAGDSSPKTKTTNIQESELVVHSEKLVSGYGSYQVADYISSNVTDGTVVGDVTNADQHQMKTTEEEDKNSENDVQNVYSINSPTTNETDLMETVRNEEEEQNSSTFASTANTDPREYTNNVSNPTLSSNQNQEGNRVIDLVSSAMAENSTGHEPRRSKDFKIKSPPHQSNEDKNTNVHASRDEVTGSISDYHVVSNEEVQESAKYAGVGSTSPAHVVDQKSESLNNEGNTRLMMNVGIEQPRAFSTGTTPIDYYQRRYNEVVLNEVKLTSTTQCGVDTKSNRATSQSSKHLSLLEYFKNCQVKGRGRGRGILNRPRMEQGDAGHLSSNDALLKNESPQSKVTSEKNEGEASRLNQPLVTTKDDFIDQKVDNDESVNPNEDSSSNGDTAINQQEVLSALDDKKYLALSDTTLENENEVNVDVVSKDKSQSEQSTKYQRGAKSTDESHSNKELEEPLDKTNEDLLNPE